MRARLHLLSEIPRRWAHAVARWSNSIEAHRQGGLPDRACEYLFYQTLVGAWPIGIERVLPFLEKANREAKVHTSWTDLDASYERAVRRFAESALQDPEFVNSVEDFVRTLVLPGRVNSLAQTLLKLTAPGVPDLYQGSELWDASLVDPDNRRPVDFPWRRCLLARLEGKTAAEVWSRQEEGLPKLWLIQRALDLRRRRPQLFGVSAGYEPLRALGERRAHVVAFARGDGAIAIAPRLVLGLETGGATPGSRYPRARGATCSAEESTNRARSPSPSCSRASRSHSSKASRREPDPGLGAGRLDGGPRVRRPASRAAPRRAGVVGARARARVRRGRLRLPSRRRSAASRSTGRAPSPWERRSCSLRGPCAFRVDRRDWAPPPLARGVVYELHTAPGASRCGASSATTPSSGFATIASTACASMRCTRFPTDPRPICWSSSVRRPTRWRARPGGPASSSRAAGASTRSGTTTSITRCTSGSVTSCRPPASAWRRGWSCSPPSSPCSSRGEEWGASSPFLYFTDHADPALAEAVREGRRRELPALGGGPRTFRTPRPWRTFERSRLDWKKREREPHSGLLEWHRRLIRLRRERSELCDGRLDRVRVRFDERERWMCVARGRVTIGCNLGARTRRLSLEEPRHAKLLLASAPEVRIARAALELPRDSLAVLASEGGAD